MKRRLLVIGNGMVGQRFLEECVALDADDQLDLELTVIGAEPEPAYNRISLSSVLAGSMTADDCRFKSPEWYDRHGIRLIVGCKAEQIDPASRVVTAGGRKIPYDLLVLATGSEAIRLSIPGASLAGVHLFRTLGDLEAISEGTKTGGRAIVIGGGLLGIEAAYGLVQRGLSVDLVHVMDRLMERQLDQQGAEILRTALERQGIRVHLNASTEQIMGEEAVQSIQLKDGSSLPADMAVMAVGIRPDIRLAQTAGLTTNRGIVIDDTLATSDLHTFAIGECAEHCGVVHGLVAPGYEQAGVLARRLAGGVDRYRGSVVATKLKVSGLPVFSAGLIEERPQSASYLDERAGIWRKVVFDNNRIVGVVLVGDTTDASWYQQMIAEGMPEGSTPGHLVFGQDIYRQAA